MSKIKLCDLIEWLSQLDSTEKHSHKIQLLTFLYPPLFASFSRPLVSSPLTSSGYELASTYNNKTYNII